ncbi:hypothetical protein L6270_00205 [Candidatus Parcubacteria bacterium]|nr:hypothetical protein [Patescibacteria group bacterium]MBU4309570.1 hypothetical protein [Patescibacteria group bacterium]MBU4432222.1 hypothetical protein [Patescibacteria group bacterium]MBU4578042.1 hypothetical protein [Patescibacteria group bacterium]MCG2696450.1 hypothetical protein [Candidatus Parcubacteria bacterium]
MTKNKIALLITIIISILIILIIGINYKRINVEENVENQIIKSTSTIQYKNYSIEFNLPENWISRLNQESVNIGSSTNFTANSYAYMRLPNVEQDAKKAVSMSDGSGWLDVQIFEGRNELDYEKLITELIESTGDKIINPDLIEFKEIRKEKNIIGGYQGYVIEYSNKYYNDYIKNNLKDIDPVMDTWNIGQVIRLSDKDVLVLSGWIDVDQVEKYKKAMEEVIQNVKIVQNSNY